MNRELAVVLTLIVYKIALVLIGVFCRKRTFDAVDFYLGGRRLGPLVAAVSASASSSSAWTLLGVSGAAYAWGMSSLWLFPGCVGGFLLNWYVLAPALQRLSHRSGAVTVTEVLAGGLPGRSGRPVVYLCSFIILVSLGTYVSSQFQGAGKAFSETFDISISSSILLGAAIVVFYTLLGGFLAVSVTDTLQGLLMAATSALLPVVALIAVGGPTELLSSLSQLPVEGYLSLDRNLGVAAATGFALGLLGIGLGYPGQPHVVNRFMALSDRPQSLRRARRIAVSWAVLVYSGMLLLGFCGRVLVPSLSDPEVVFITLTNTLFPPIASGVMLAAVLSAIMSTADSQLLVASSTVTQDLSWRIRPSWSDLLRSRIVVLVLSGGAVAGALLGSQQIFSQVLFAWAAMGSAFGPLLLAIAYGWKISRGWRLASIVTGFTLSVLAFYLVPAGNSWKGMLERTLPFLVAGVLVWLGQRSDSGRRPS
jgi:sodium/proline symporter